MALQSGSRRHRPDLHCGAGCRSASALYQDVFVRTIAQSANLRAFIHPMLRRLQEYDQAHSTALLHTLCVYLLQEQNLHATARQLFIHRNTLVYRLQRIRTLLQLDLDDAAVRNVLRTAVSCWNTIRVPSDFSHKTSPGAVCIPHCAGASLVCFRYRVSTRSNREPAASTASLLPKVTFTPAAMVSARPAACSLSRAAVHGTQGLAVGSLHCLGDAAEILPVQLPCLGAGLAGRVQLGHGTHDQVVQVLFGVIAGGQLRRALAKVS